MTDTFIDEDDNSCSSNKPLFLSKLTKYIDFMHGSDKHRPQGSLVTAPFPCQVVEVLIKEGTELQPGQPILKVLVPSSYVPFRTSSSVAKSKYKDAIERNSRTGIYPLEDVTVDHRLLLTV